MAIIDSAVNGKTGSGKAYFFHGDQYCEFDWNRATTSATGAVFHGRAVGGPYSLASQWALPLDMQFWGFGSSLDAILSGDGGGSPTYASKLWMFKGASYARYDYSDLPPRLLDTNGPITAWNLGAGFSQDLDGAFNGKGTRLGYAYMFKGPQYLRYKWSSETVDTGYPKAISSLANMPALFHNGIDAAIDGDGPAAAYGYLIRDDQYCRFNWTNVEVDNGPNHMWDDWPGVLEYLLAGEARAIALEWVQDAHNQLGFYIAELATGFPSPFDTALMATALATHFHIPATMPTAQQIPRLQAIHAQLVTIEGKLVNLSDHLVFHDDAEVATVDASYVGADGRARVRAYTNYDLSTFITSSFVRMSDTPFSAAAVLIHETVHLVDAQAVLALDSPEWYTTGKAPMTTPTGQMVPFYDTLSPDVAQHNPSSYNAFSQHVHFGIDRRLGEERLRDGFW